MTIAIRILTMILMLAACGEKEDEVVAVSDKTFAEGTWFTACAEATNGYEMKSLTFDRDDFLYVSALYADETCTTLDNQIVGRGRFELKGAVAVEKVGTATAVDYIFSDLIWMFELNPADALDYAAACVSTEEHGVVDVLGKTCELAGEETIAFPKKQYGTILMQVDKLLITDINSNGATEEERSKELAIDTGWTKAEEEEEDAEEDTTL